MVFFHGVHLVRGLIGPDKDMWLVFNREGLERLSDQYKSSASRLCVDLVDLCDEFFGSRLVYFVLPKRSTELVLIGKFLCVCVGGCVVSAAKFDPYDWMVYACVQG